MTEPEKADDEYGREYVQNLVAQVVKLDVRIAKLEPLVPENARLKAELKALRKAIEVLTERKGTDAHTIKRLQDRIDLLVSELKERRDGI